MIGPVPMVGGLNEPAPVAVVCAEDARCWRWRTMGDHRRGIVTIGGRKRVVGPRAFDRANRGFWIDWRRTPRLPGDGRRYDARDY